jgi:hypothetical protein
MAKQTLATTLQGFSWSNEPGWWRLADALELRTEPDTDFWQRTHYGFQHDNGHFFGKTVAGDFELRAHFWFAPTAQYDQCGLMGRVDAEHWIKCSTEYETPTLSRLGSVVTNGGYSDWATQDVSSGQSCWYALKRHGPDFSLAWSNDGRVWQQMRITHLHHCPEQVRVGLYACSPTGAGFECRVDNLELSLAGS